MAATFVWDPDRVLQITDLGRNEIVCIGRAARRFNSRCTWNIEEPDRSKVSSLLRSMAQKAPTEVRKKELRVLAGLCLCYQAHQHQQEEAFFQLQSRLQYACDDYERFSMLQNQSTELAGHVGLLNEQINGVLDVLSIPQKVIEEQNLCDILRRRLAESEDQRTPSRALIDRISLAEVQIETASAQLAEYRTTIAKLEETNGNLQARETDLCQKANKQTMTVSKLQETKRGLETQLAEMSRQLNQQKTTMAELEKSGSNSQKMSDHLEQLLQKEKLTVTGLEQAKTGLKAQLIELCQQLEKRNVAVDELEASKSDLQLQLRDLRQQMNKQNTAVTDLEDETQTLKDQHTTRLAKLGTSQLELEQMKSEFQSVKISNVDLQRQLDEAIFRADLAIQNAWQSRIRKWLQACQLPFTEAFRWVRQGLAMPSAKLKRSLRLERFFRGTDHVVGQYSELGEEMHPRHSNSAAPPV